VIIASCLINVSTSTSGNGSSVAGADAKAIYEESRKKAIERDKELAKQEEDRKQAERTRLLNEAGNYCVENVKNSLLSPSSARFSDVNMFYVTSRDVYYVWGIVDSQNVYGAMLRSTFRHFLTYRGGRWNDITDSLSDKEVSALIEAA